MNNSGSQQLVPSPASLRRLAEVGLSAFPLAALEEASADAWAWCEATGDGTYCVLSRVLDMMDDWFPGEGHGVAVSFLRRVADILTRELPGVLKPCETRSTRRYPARSRVSPSSNAPAIAIWSRSGRNLARPSRDRSDGSALVTANGHRRRARRTTSAMCGLSGGGSMRGSTACSSKVKSSRSSATSSSAPM